MGATPIPWVQLSCGRAQALGKAPIPLATSDKYSCWKESGWMSCRQTTEDPKSCHVTREASLQQQLFPTALL